MKTFDTFKKHDFDTRRQKLLNVVYQSKGEYIYMALILLSLIVVFIQRSKQNTL